MKKDNPVYDTMDFFMVWSNLSLLSDYLNQNPDEDIPAESLARFVGDTLSYFPRQYTDRVVQPYFAFVKNNSGHSPLNDPQNDSE